MAKTTKKTTKSTVKKQTVAASIKEPVKKIAVEPEKKKITAKPEAKKITVSKEPEKIAVKPEPKKITTKEIQKLETKEVKSVVAKKVEPSKKAKPVKKEAVKKEALKKEVQPAKTEVVVAEAKPVKKEAVKKTVAKKASEKKATPKPTPAKKVAKQSISQDKMEEMMSYSLDKCISMLQAIGVMHSYEAYMNILLDEANLEIVEKNIIEGNRLREIEFDYDKNNFDMNLIKITLAKVSATMDLKASDYAIIKKDMSASMKVKLSKDDDKNAKEYLNEFKTAEKILMIGQRKNITVSSDVSELIGGDIEAFVEHFFNLAYEILPTWQYDDVKFYEDFAYAILSQYTDLYAKYQLRILIDCADLYIQHGDFVHGDECYGYILRDNQIKDYIYYRYVSVYENIDMNKAKGIAYESLQYVDDRYMYYPNIMEVLNK